MRTMDSEAPLIEDVALVCIAVVLCLAISPWAGFGLVLGAYVTQRIMR